MGLPLPFQTGYTGMAQDASRDGFASSALYSGALWNCVDYFPNSLQAPLRKRGGWTWGSPVIGSVTGVDRMLHAEFAAGSQLLAIDNAAPAHLWKITSPTTTVDEGSTGFSGGVGAPFFHRDKVIIPAYDGTSTPKYYDGSSIAALSGAPAGKYGCVYLDYSVLAAPTSAPQAVYFSDPGDPTSWDTTNSVMSVSQPITGIAALRNAILVFSSHQVQRVRGTIPPPGTDMIVEGLFQVGCVDHRSIASWNEDVIWADTDGVYLTDGASMTDLTVVGGMQKYWRDMLASYSTSYRIVGGVFRNYYFVSIQNGSTFVDTLVCDLSSRTWFRMSNMNARCYTVLHGQFQDFYMGLNGTGRIAKLTDIFNPSSSNMSDADGTGVLPYFETSTQHGWVRFRRRWIPSEGKTTWKWFYASYDVRDGASNNPALAISYLTDPGGSSYTSIGSLPTTTQKGRGRCPIRIGTQTIGFKVAQTAVSADTRIYTLESDYTTREVGNL